MKQPSDHNNNPLHHILIKKVKPQHPIYQNKMLLPEDDVYTTHDKDKQFFYWASDGGIIPLHEDPDMEAELESRIALKRHLKETNCEIDN